MSQVYLTLSSNEWAHERPGERQTEKNPSIWEQLEDAKWECESRKDPDKSVPQKKPLELGDL